jgi:hypothetical protein
MRIVTELCVFVVVMLGIIHGQGTISTHPEVSPVLNRMKSSAWRDRSEAFSEAAKLLASGKMAPNDSDSLRLGVIRLLAAENSDETPALDERDGEENSEYYSSLIDFVAHSGDERGIRALLGAAMTGGTAIRRVARFGERALEPTLDQAKSSDPKLASGAVYVLQKMLETGSVSDQDSHQRIKTALRSALDSPESSVRQAAVFAIEYLSDRTEFAPKLKNLADHDPEKLPGQPKSDGTVGDIYPVRELAAKLLRKIANHEPPLIDRGVSD